MRRALAAAALLLCAPAAALAQETPAAPQAERPRFDRSRCQSEDPDGMTTAEADACIRRLLAEEIQARIAERRVRVQKDMAQRRVDVEARKREERARSAERGAPLDSFLYESLSYGDIVVTDEGPRVYVGAQYSVPRKEDFVPLDSKRSPHRTRADAIKRATRAANPGN